MKKVAFILMLVLGVLVTQIKMGAADGSDRWSENPMPDSVVAEDGLLGSKNWSENSFMNDRHLEAARLGREDVHEFLYLAEGGEDNPGGDQGEELVEVLNAYLIPKDLTPTPFPSDLILTSAGTPILTNATALQLSILSLLE